MLTLARAGQAVVASSFPRVAGEWPSALDGARRASEAGARLGQRAVSAREAVGYAHVRVRRVVLPVCRDGSGVGWAAACTIAVVRVIASCALSCCSRMSERQEDGPKVDEPPRDGEIPS